MKVTVEHSFTGETQTFEGSGQHVQEQLLFAYPFLRAYAGPQDSLDDILEHLEGSQAFLVEVEDATGHTEPPPGATGGPDDSLGKNEDPVPADLWGLLGKAEGVRRPFAFKTAEAAEAFEGKCKGWASDFERRHGVAPKVKRFGKVVIISVPIEAALDDVHDHADDHGGKHIGGKLAKAQGEGTPGKAPADPMAAAHAEHPLAGTHADGLEIHHNDIPNVGSLGSTLDNYSTLKGIREVSMEGWHADPHKMFYAADDIQHCHDLAQQISANGHIKPLIVVHEKAGPYVLEGGHRLGALHLLGKKSFPALVAVDHDSFEKSLGNAEEDLGKAIAGIQPKAKLNDIKEENDWSGAGHKDFKATYDYSHLLPERHIVAPNPKDALQLHVHHTGSENTTTGKIRGEMIKAVLTNGWGDHFGHVKGFVGKKDIHGNANPDGEEVIEPHSDLDDRYKGKGLGTAMYEAAFAHAKNVVGINTVHGGIHSQDADNLHRRLAAKHGFEYHAERDESVPDDALYPYKGYRYQLKAEGAEPPVDDSLLIGPHRCIVFSRGQEMDKGLGNEAGRHHVVLPVGAVHLGQIKVKDPTTGHSKWRSVQSGLVMTPDGTPGSALNPSGK